MAQMVSPTLLSILLHLTILERRLGTAPGTPLLQPVARDAWETLVFVCFPGLQAEVGLEGRLASPSSF